MDQQLKELLIERLFLDLKPEDIDADTPLGDYGIDSFLLLELIVGIEEQFNVKFEPADISADALRSIGSLRALIETKLQPPPA